jgi:glutamate---cysteine ligase / carboxylate-amine ligase
VEIHVALSIFILMPNLTLFSAYGVELEYMIVDSKSLNIKPIADQILYSIAGAYVGDVEVGEIAWSNELVLHVVELKTNGPKSDLLLLPKLFQESITKINQILKPLDACLLPTGAHPWMDPNTETKLWPHEANPVYEAYNKIFGCCGHGWANLQSVHLNLPFASDAEFAKLHTAIRLLLPIIPALSASTPIVDGKVNGILDNRLDFYCKNQQKIPAIAGQVIPESVVSRAEYEAKILQKIYQAIAPYDSKKILQHEWLNSRGAIARFERNTIEIRIIDSQECPRAEIAILYLVVAVLKALVAELWIDFEVQLAWPEQDLARIFFEVIRKGQAAVIDNRDFLQVFGYKGSSCVAKVLWEHIIEQLLSHGYLDDNELLQVIELILAQGNLAERILETLANCSTSANLKHVYSKLAECLQKGNLFCIVKG